MSKSKIKSAVAAVLVLSGTLATGIAQAGPVDVQWSIVVGTPVYAQTMPVYTQPRPVYAQPEPVYTRPWAVHARPAPVWNRPAPAHRHGGHWQAAQWDRDRDGIPNRADRLYNPRWDRDGDGIANRHDRYTKTGHDRDDGRDRNRHDRNDRHDSGAGRGR